MKFHEGQTIEIIYLDRNNKLTQRHIRVRSIRGEFILATCLLTGAPRTFRMGSILAWRPVRHVS